MTNYDKETQSEVSCRVDEEIKASPVIDKVVRLGIRELNPNRVDMSALHLY